MVIFLYRLAQSTCTMYNCTCPAIRAEKLRPLLQYSYTDLLGDNRMPPKSPKKAKLGYRLVEIPELYAGPLTNYI